MSRIVMIEDMVADIDVHMGEVFFIWKDQAGRILGQTKYRKGAAIDVACSFPEGSNAMTKLVQLSYNLLGNHDIFDMTGAEISLVPEGSVDSKISEGDISVRQNS